MRISASLVFKIYTKCIKIPMTTWFTVIFLTLTMESRISKLVKIDCVCERVYYIKKCSSCLDIFLVYFQYQHAREGNLTAPENMSGQPNLPNRVKLRWQLSSYNITCDTSSIPLLHGESGMPQQQPVQESFQAAYTKRRLQKLVNYGM